MDRIELDGGPLVHAGGVGGAVFFPAFVLVSGEGLPSGGGGKFGEVAMLAGLLAAEEQGYVLSVGGVGGGEAIGAIEARGGSGGGSSSGAFRRWRLGGIHGIGGGGHRLFLSGRGFRFGFVTRFGASGKQKQGGGQEPKRGGAKEHWMRCDEKRRAPEEPNEAASYGRSFWRSPHEARRGQPLPGTAPLPWRRGT